MTRGQDPDLDPYKILQLDPEADPEIIQVVYRRLARRYHPDVSPGLAAAAKMIELNAAMDILSDPTRRAAYDRERARRERTAARTTATAGHSTRSPAGAQGASGGGSGTATTPAGRPGRGTGIDGAADPTPTRPRPQTVSQDWTSGRSTVGSGYDPSRMRAPEGDGAAGPPPGDPSGSVLNFGRYAGWSLGEIARRDLEYIEWLDRMTIGRTYRPELDAILRGAGRRRGAPVEEDRRGLFRRS
jgi:curved DNA-binding protein CbpA